MILAALRGGIGFLTRLPAGRSRADWEAFVAIPAAAVVVAYLVGVVASLPLALLGPPPVAAFAGLVALYGLTGIAHADGLADAGDAAAVHGDAAERRRVMTTSEVGAGGAVVLGLSLVGHALAFVAVAGLGASAVVAVVVAAEVGAKLAVVALAVLGEPARAGSGAAMAEDVGPRHLLVALALALPAVGLGWWAAWRVGRVSVSMTLAEVLGGAAVATGGILAALLVALAVGRWARARLGGLSGDVLGATNELARLAALHVGVLAWTLW